MVAFKLIIALTITLLVCITGQAQTTKTIDSLENETKRCYDKGGYMLGCAKKFYYQMDSMLNVVYFKLRSGFDSTQKVSLKKEQLKWLATRDAFFKSTFKKFKKNNPAISPYGSAWGAQDDAMFMYDDNAKYIKKRVLILLQRLQGR